APEPSPPAAFAEHHRRLSTDPASPFVQTLVVQRPRADRIVTLRARTLSERGPAVDTSRVLEEAEFGDVLADLGVRLEAGRRERLWDLACAQHSTFTARSGRR